jgi:uncharacterized oxidoreductase
MPVYYAAKAVIHSFTVALRHQLKDTSIKVFEIVPLAVDTELGMGTTSNESQEYRGILPVVVAEVTIKALAKNEYEIIVGEAMSLV